MYKWYSALFCFLIGFFIIHEKSFAENDGIVQANRTYTYEDMTEDLERLKKAYPELIHVESLGKTNFNREIWAVRVGNGRATILINASHHAREWLTTNIAMEMIDTYAKAYVENETIDKYDVQELLENVSIWFVPMVNPDGVTLQQVGLKAFPESSHEQLISLNRGSTDFRRWKANMEGIDLNRQYPASWETLTGVASRPGYKWYKGEKPLQALEAKVMVDFTYRIKPEIAISYHTAGQTVYWHGLSTYKKTKTLEDIVDRYVSMTGYQKTYYTNWGGGFSDWFMETFDRPAFTPEIGPYSAENNVDISEFDDEWKRNKVAGLMFASEGYKLWMERDGETFYKYYNTWIQILSDWKKYINPFHLLNVLLEKE